MKYKISISFDPVEFTIDAENKFGALAIAISNLLNLKIEDLVKSPRSVFIDEPFKNIIDEQH